MLSIGSKYLTREFVCKKICVGLSLPCVSLLHSVTAYGEGRVGLSRFRGSAIIYGVMPCFTITQLRAQSAILRPKLYYFNVLCSCCIARSWTTNPQQIEVMELGFKQTQGPW